MGLVVLCVEFVDCCCFERERGGDGRKELLLLYRPHRYYCHYFISMTSNNDANNGKSVKLCGWLLQVSLFVMSIAFM